MGRSLLTAALALALAGCGGTAAPAGSSTGGITPGPSPSPSPTPTATCSLRARQDWAAAQIREWYLFPQTLPATLDPTPYATVSDYIDALTATARGQGRDRFFTYLTSIASEDAYLNSGSTAAFGIRLQTDSVARRVFVADAYENAPALAAGIDRGAEIIGIGTSETDVKTVDSILAGGGAAALTDAFGPTTAGVTRVLRLASGTGTRDVTITKADFSIEAVSPRYGVQILDDGGTKVGYVNLRTFISPAEPALRNAFASFRAAGITRVIVDLRYNGGGLVSTAEYLADLMGDNRFASDVIDYTTYRPEKSSSNQTRAFRRQSQSVAPMKLAFIGTGDTASASELVINAFTPYFKANSALIGTNTFGKPVGQIPLDRAACDDRLRVVAFATENADRQGGYFNGLASTVGASCAASDELLYPMGDPRENSTRIALDSLAGRSCTAISTAAKTQTASASASKRSLLMPNRPDPAQRDLPGTF